MEARVDRPSLRKSCQRLLIVGPGVHVDRRRVVDTELDEIGAEIGEPRAEPPIVRRTLGPQELQGEDDRMTRAVPVASSEGGRPTPPPGHGGAPDHFGIDPGLITEEEEKARPPRGPVGGPVEAAGETAGELGIWEDVDRKIGQGFPDPLSRVTGDHAHRLESGPEGGAHGRPDERLIGVGEKELRTPAEPSPAAGCEDGGGEGPGTGGSGVERETGVRPPAQLASPSEISSASIAMAIWTGERAPMSSPTGPRIRSTSSCAKPSSRSDRRRPSCVRRPPSSPT